MICLLWDYLQYRSLKGHYDNGARSFIPNLFDERITEEVLSTLKPGDLIWTGSKHSIRSWLIMYYCQVPVSHVAIYLGKRRIAHATTDRGSVEQKIDDLFNRGLRFLPCRMLSVDEAKRNLLQEVTRKNLGRPYWYRYVIFAWLYIVSGRNWGTFKWKFYFDFLSIYLLFAVFAPFPFKYIFCSLAVIHLAIILIFALLWKFKPIRFHQRGISLNMFFAQLWGSGAMIPIINTGEELKM